MEPAALKNTLSLSLTLPLSLSLSLHFNGIFFQVNLGEPVAPSFSFSIYSWTADPFRPDLNFPCHS